MKKVYSKKLKQHLKSYKIASRRKSTLNHAFASALAPYDEYDEAKANEAITLLGQNPEGDITCFYCGKEMSTWDHIHAIVKDTDFSGYGHQIRNLVPSCRDCNSKKGNEEVDTFIDNRDIISDKELKKRIIKDYTAPLAKSLNSNGLREKYPVEMREYDRIKKEIFDLIDRADEVANIIRIKEKQRIN